MNIKKLSNRTISFISIASMLTLPIWQTGCKPIEKNKKATIVKEPFGQLSDGRPVDIYTLTNINGTQVQITNFGGVIVSIKTPDKEGKFEEITLGFDSLSSYTKGTPFFGALIGRYGNRIAKGKFTLDSITYTLAVNNIGNHLHGGIVGFDKVLWKAEEAQTDNGVALKLSYESKDMEEGYPGNLLTEVIYTLKDDNGLLIDYKAKTDKPTVVNLTNHTYFNLTGGREDILNHQLTLLADRFLPVDSTLIPTGELKEVKGTPFDFTNSSTIGTRINENDTQLKYGLGYDHCWVLNNTSDSLSLAASLYEPKSGRVLEVYTLEPAIQFYSGNFLDGSLTGKGGIVYKQRYGLCLETQHFPDAPNQSTFPSTVLRPGQVYHTQTIYKFSVK